MNHIKKLFEYYEEDFADDKDMVNIIQDIKDLDFKVTISIKYLASSLLDSMSFDSQFTSAASKDSVKCYFINITRRIKSDTIDQLSDLLYELQTTFSRLSDVGKVTHYIKIATNKNRYMRRQEGNITDVLVKLIVATSDKIEIGSAEALSDELKKNGFKAELKNGRVYVKIFDTPLGERPGGWYSQDKTSKEVVEWQKNRNDRMVTCKKEWERIKKIARGLKISVRGHIDTTGINIGFAAKSVNTKVKTIS